MRERDGVVILWQAEAFLSWVAAAPGGDGGLSRLGYLASMWESARELVPAGGHVVRHRAFGAWDGVDKVAERLHEMGVELVHIPRCSVEQANYHLALEALGLVSMQVVPQRLILVGCDASALPLARAVHRAGVPVAAVVCNLLESDFANWSFAVEPVVCVEHPTTEEAEDDAEVDSDAWVSDDDVEDSATEDETSAEPSAVIAVAPRKPWTKTIVSERVPVHVEVLPVPVTRVADLSNPANVAKLMMLGTGRSWTEGRSTRSAPQVAATVLDWVEKMGAPPRSNLSLKAFRDEFEQLDKHARNAELLRELSQPAHLAVLGWLVNRLRNLQEVAQEMPSEETQRLNGVMGMLAQHSRDHQPGYLNGLKRVHEPERSSWHEDALHWAETARAELSGKVSRGSAPTRGSASHDTWNRDNTYRELFELVRTDGPADGTLILAKVRELLEHGVPPSDKRLVHAMLEFDHLLGAPEFSRLLALVRDERGEREREAKDDDVSDARTVPQEWPGFVFTRGKRVVIIGGDERPERRERLREEFEFGEVEWVETSPNAGVARVHDLAQRMKNGSVELVIVLQAWVSHRITDIVFGTDAPGCEVVLAATYGVTQVQRAVERYLLGIRHD